MSMKSQYRTFVNKQMYTRPMVCLVITLILSCMTGCGVRLRRSSHDYIEDAKRFASESRLRDATHSLRKAIQQDPRSFQAHLLLARLESKVGNSLRAAAAYRGAVQLAPSAGPVHAEAAANLLRVYLEDGRHPQSLRREIEGLLPLLEKSGQHAESDRIHGYLALSSRDTSLARTHFKAALDKRPEDAEIALALVNTLSSLREFRQAEEVAVSAIAKNPKNGGLYDGLYLLYLTMNRTADAEKLVTSRLRSNPGDGYAVMHAALHHHRQGRLSQAAGVIDEFLAEPRYEHRFLVASAYFERVGDFPTAVTLLRKGIEAVPQQGFQHRQHAVQVLIKMGKRDEALRLVDELLQKHGENRDIQALKAVLQLERGRPDDLESAFTTLRHLTRKEPDNVQWRYQLGRALVSRGQRDLANSEWREVLKEDPRFLEARLGLAELALADGRPKETLQHAAQVLSFDASNERAKVLRAAALVMSGTPAEARRELEVYLRFHPGSRDLELQLGLALLAERQYPKAEAVFRRHQQSDDPDIRPLRGLAEIHLARKQFDDAIKLLNSYLADGDKPEIRSLLAGVAMSAGRPEVAVEQYQALLVKQPSSAELHVRLGESLFRAGQLDHAAAEFRRASSLASSNPQPDLLLGWVLGKANKKEEAAAAYLNALKKSPTNPVALTNLSEHYTDIGNVNEALRLAQLALQQAPEDPRVAETLGKVYLKREEAGVAKSIFSRLVNKYPDAVEFRTLLGQSQLETGDHAAARVTLTTALEQAQPETRQKIEQLMARLPQHYSR